MKFVLEAERLRDGKSIRLTQNEERYQLLEVDGLDVPEADISDYDVASLDGVRVNHIKMSEREITISVAIFGDVETNRQALYDIFRIKDVIRLHIQTKNRDVYIDGYCRRPACNNFEQQQIMDITILCPTPYFNDETTTVVNTSKREPFFEFPIYLNDGESIDDKTAHEYNEQDGFYTNIDSPIEFSTLNPERSAEVQSISENETGVTIIADFNADATKLTINNEDTAQYMIINYNFKSGDRLTICTILGQKSITLLRSGITYNMIPYITTDSSWFQLQAGSNNFNYVVGTEDGDDPTLATVEMEILYVPIYYGI